MGESSYHSRRSGPGYKPQVRGLRGLHLPEKAHGQQHHLRTAEGLEKPNLKTHIRT